MIPGKVYGAENTNWRRKFWKMRQLKKKSLSKFENDLKWSTFSFKATVNTKKTEEGVKALKA